MANFILSGSILKNHISNSYLVTIIAIIFMFTVKFSLSPNVLTLYVLHVSEGNKNA